MIRHHSVRKYKDFKASYEHKIILTFPDRVVGTRTSTAMQHLDARVKNTLGYKAQAQLYAQQQLAREL